MFDKTFIFVAGLHRSGTSLLHQILRSHPDISGFENTGVPEDEGQHLQSIFPTASVFGGAGRFGFHAESFMTETHPLATPENASLLYEQWCKYWDLSRPYLVEKSPPNLVRTRFLQKLFPNSRFIVILRHPVAVAYAVQKRKTSDMDSLIHHWLICHEKLLEDRPYLQNNLILRYEDLVTSPQQVLEQVFRFVGVNSISVNQFVDSTLNEKYFDIWRQQRREPKQWRSLYTSILKYEGRVRRFGYQLTNLRALHERKSLYTAILSDTK